jgi:hypothetical protein
MMAVNYSGRPREQILGWDIVCEEKHIGICLRHCGEASLPLLAANKKLSACAERGKEGCCLQHWERTTCSPIDVSLRASDAGHKADHADA